MTITNTAVDVGIVEHSTLAICARGLWKHGPGPEQAMCALVLLTLQWYVLT